MHHLLLDVIRNAHAKFAPLDFIDKRCYWETRQTQHPFNCLYDPQDDVTCLGSYQDDQIRNHPEPVRLRCLATEKKEKSDKMEPQCLKEHNTFLYGSWIGLESLPKEN